MQIENDGTTFAQAILLKPRKREYSPHSYNKKFSTLLPESSQMKQQQISNNRTVSDIDGYLKKVLSIIEQCINQNPYGITSQKLYDLLSSKLGAKFEFSLFNCKSFNEYLSKYLEPIADIMLKMNTYIIYPKNTYNQQNMQNFKCNLSQNNDYGQLQQVKGMPGQPLNPAFTQAQLNQQQQQAYLQQ